MFGTRGQRASFSGLGFRKIKRFPQAISDRIRQLLSGRGLRTRGNDRHNRLAAQSAFVRALCQAQDVPQAAAVTLEFLRNALSPRQALIAILQDGKLIVQGAIQPGADATIGKPLGIGEGLCQWTLEHRRALAADVRNKLPSGLSLEGFDFPPVMAAPLICRQTPHGVILLGGRPDQPVFNLAERMLLDFVADSAAAIIGGIEDREAIERHYVGTIASLMETVEAKDNYTRGHTERVRDLAVQLAEVVGIEGRNLEDIARAAALHDIGKIGVPDRIITKPGALNAEELAIIRKHPSDGDRILRHLRFLFKARMIIRGHHERYDGWGYPDGLSGQEIPLGARILAIADAYDAMASARPYRAAMRPSQALEEIRNNAGTQFDPELVATFLEMLEPQFTTQPEGNQQALARESA